MRLHWDIRRYGVVGSTNDEARQLALNKAPHGTVVVAEGQTAGRGRATHTWFSPEGRGLYTSFILHPRVPTTQLPSLTLVAGLAVCDALTTFEPIPAQIKWPNDVWLLGKKVGGILSELLPVKAGHSQLNDASIVLIGIGINVNLRETEFPPELRHTATSLAMVRGQPLDRELVLQALLPAFAARYQQWHAYSWAALRAAYLERSAIEGLRVTVTFGADRREGIVRGVDQTGAVCLETAPGLLETIVAGELQIIF